MDQLEILPIVDAQEEGEVLCRMDKRRQRGDHSTFDEGKPVIFDCLSWLGDCLASTTAFVNNGAK